MYQSTLTSKKVDFMEEICILFNFLGKTYSENYYFKESSIVHELRYRRWLDFSFGCQDQSRVFFPRHFPLDSKTQLNQVF